MLDDESCSHARCVGLGGQNATDGNQPVRFVRATKYNAPIPVQLIYLFRGKTCPKFYIECLLK
jgi:hypothetical protein